MLFVSDIFSCIYLVRTRVHLYEPAFTCLNPRSLVWTRVHFRGVYPPLSGGSKPPSSHPPPDGPRWESSHDIHALYLSQVGVSEREEIIKAPIIIEGAKHPRIEGSKVEKLSNLKFITIVMQWYEWFINTGEALLKICHPVPKLHTTHLVLTPLSSLSYNSYRARGLGMQSYIKASPTGFRAAPQRLRRSR